MDLMKSVAWSRGPLTEICRSPNLQEGSMSPPPSGRCPIKILGQGRVSGRPRGRTLRKDSAQRAGGGQIESKESR